MSQYVLLRIQALQEELETLKKTVIHQFEGSRNKTHLKGLWKNTMINDKDLKEAEKAVFRDAVHWEDQDKMDTYVVDTHALAQFFSEDKRLSPRATKILSQAEVGEVQILISTLVLAELIHIAQKKRVEVTIEELLAKINQGDGFNIVPFDFSIFQTMLQLPENWDIHDRIIAATASYYQATLITRDEVLRNSPEVKTVWD